MISLIIGMIGGIAMLIGVVGWIRSYPTGISQTSTEMLSNRHRSITISVIGVTLVVIWALALAYRWF